MRLFSLLYALAVCLASVPFALWAQVSHYPRDFQMKGVAFHGDTCWVEVLEHAEDHANAYTIQVLLNDGTAILMGHDAYMQWLERTQSSTLVLAYQVSVEEKSSKFVYPLAQLTIKSPAYNTELFNIYQEELRFACPEGWNNAMGMEKGVDFPKIESSYKPRLCYAFPQGLYFNYEVTKCYYFPDVRVMVVFTKNAIKCLHQAPANGFLIFRL